MSEDNGKSSHMVWNASPALADLSTNYQGLLAHILSSGDQKKASCVSVRLCVAVNSKQLASFPYSLC